MKSFTQDTVNPEIPGIMIMSHGPLALGLVDTAKMLFGEPENIAAFSLEAGDDINEFRNMFVQTFEKFPENSMIMVDLYGGSPFNQALQYAQESNKVFELMTGVNLPMFLDAVDTRNMSKGKTATLGVIGNAKAGINRVDIEEFLSSASDDDEDDE